LSSWQLCAVAIRWAWRRLGPRCAVRPGLRPGGGPRAGKGGGTGGRAARPPRPAPGARRRSARGAASRGFRRCAPAARRLVCPFCRLPP